MIWARSTSRVNFESGGRHGADGLAVLKAAAQGAKEEGADLTTVFDALTSAMQDYHEPASAAADVTSKLVAATSQGKMTFEQLAGSLSAVLPVASANHISLNDILGDLASMTVHGVSAEQASQNLANAIRSLAAPTQAQSKELAALGLNATDISSKLGERGLSSVNYLARISGVTKSYFLEKGHRIVLYASAAPNLKCKCI
jgi:TP901 family phage tail tape measure protein